MLVPHGAENAQLGKGGLAADDIEDALIFVGLEAVGLDQFGRDCRVLHLNGIPLGGPVAAFFSAWRGPGEGGAVGAGGLTPEPVWRSDGANKQEKSCRAWKIRGGAKACRIMCWRGHLGPASMPQAR